MTNEDNDDTKNINKNNTDNHDARDLHEWARHVERAVSVRHDYVSWSLRLKSFKSLSSSRHVAHVSFSLIFTYLPFYFNLSFPVFFHSSVLMHPDLHSDLNILDSVENNLRHSAKGSNDAYDVSHSLTVITAKLGITWSSW